MSDGFFDAPLFIREIESATVDLAVTPFFYNAGGCPRYVAQLPDEAIVLEPPIIDPAVALGREYLVSGSVEESQNKYGVTNRLDLVADQVVYEPLWVTHEVAAAFGMLLVEPGQGVWVQSPVTQLSQINYEYGVFAGHQSPYQGTGKRLLTVVCTDLEFHAFPHVFASIDAGLPLVVSVGRYWPDQGRICLADLWVPRGHALYVPPRPIGEKPVCLDLHNNRNSARACWGNLQRDSIFTQTLLQAEGGYFHWYWNATPTVHENLPLKPDASAVPVCLP